MFADRANRLRGEVIAHGHPASRVWLPLFWGLVALVSLGIYVRMWKARSSPDEIKKIKAQSLYGVLPPKFRDWLFP